MLTISIYRGDQRLKAHAAFDGDLPQTVPELVFKADAGLVALNSNRALRRALRTRRVQASLMCHRYYAFLESSPKSPWRPCSPAPACRSFAGRALATGHDLPDG